MVLAQLAEGQLDQHNGVSWQGVLSICGIGGWCLCAE